MSYRSNWQLSWDTIGQKVCPFSESRHSSRMEAVWYRIVDSKGELNVMMHVQDLEVLEDFNSSLHNHRVPSSVSLYCVPKQCSSIIVDPAKLILLVIVLFGEALEMITLSPRSSVPVSCSRWQTMFDRICRYTLRSFCTTDICKCMP